MDTGSTRLRFDQRYVRASEIAEQFYCERKVENHEFRYEFEYPIDPRWHDGGMVCPL